MKKTLSLFISLSQKLLLTILPSFCLTILLSFSLAILLSSPARAQDNLGEKPPWRDSSFGQEYDDADLGSVNAGAYVDRTTKANMASISCMILPSEGLCTEDPKKLIPMLRRSAVGVISSNIAAMYMTPPADTRLFLADLGQTLGFIPKTAYAQGIGITGLSALLPLWKAFRNIAYLLMAIVMIVIGFMVMFRKKIDPKTVVTVQNAIPKIVVTLLLITFSYAIVGLMVDLMYLSILLVVGIFNSAGLLPEPGSGAQLFGYKTAQDLYANGGLLANFVDVERNPYKLIGIKISSGLGDAISMVLGTVLAIGGLLLQQPKVAIGGAILGLAMPLLHLLLSLAMLFLFIRLLIFFLGSYIQIILALLFGPIQLLMEALPGSSSFSSWFKNLLSNMVVFPISAMIFILSAVFANFANGDGKFWAPPYVGLVNNVTSIASLISLGLLFTIPSIAGAIKEALKAKPFVNAGPEGIVGAVTQPGALAWQIGQFWISHNQMGKIAKSIKAQQEGGGESHGATGAG